MESVETMRLDTESLARGRGGNVFWLVVVVGTVLVGCSSCTFCPFSFCRAWRATNTMLSRPLVELVAREPGLPPERAVMLDGDSVFLLDMVDDL